MNNSYWERLFEKIRDIITALSGGTPVLNDDYKDVYSSFWLKLFTKLDEVIAAILQGGGGGGGGGTMNHADLNNRDIPDQHPMSAITGLGTAATKDTGDFASAEQGSKADGALPITGGTMTGDLTLKGAPSTDNMAANKKYVDDKAAAVIAGDELGYITFGRTNASAPLPAAVSGNKLWDFSNNKLYTYTTSWDSGVQQTPQQSAGIDIITMLDGVDAGGKDMTGHKCGGIWSGTAWTFGIDNNTEYTFGSTFKVNADGSRDVGDVTLAAGDIADDNSKYVAGTFDIFSFLKSIPRKINALFTAMALKADLAAVQLKLYLGSTAVGALPLSGRYIKVGNVGTGASLSIIVGSLRCASEYLNDSCNILFRFRGNTGPTFQAYADGFSNFPVSAVIDKDTGDCYIGLLSGYEYPTVEIFAQTTPFIPVVTATNPTTLPNILTYMMTPSKAFKRITFTASDYYNEIRGKLAALGLDDAGKTVVFTTPYSTTSGFNPKNEGGIVFATSGGSDNNVYLTLLSQSGGLYVCPAYNNTSAKPVWKEVYVRLVDPDNRFLYSSAVIGVPIPATTAAVPTSWDASLPLPTADTAIVNTLGVVRGFRAADGVVGSWGSLADFNGGVMPATTGLIRSVDGTITPKAFTVSTPDSFIGNIADLKAMYSSGAEVLTSEIVGGKPVYQRFFIGNIAAAAGVAAYTALFQASGDVPVWLDPISSWQMGSDATRVNGIHTGSLGLGTLCVYKNVTHYVSLNSCSQYARDGIVNCQYRVVVKYTKA